MVHATAALTSAGWLLAGASLHDAIITAIAVLIITCPCALALAIPAVQVVASGALFRAGIILNAGDAIERLAEVDTVVFDKTGTLTLPEPRVANAVGVYDPDLLEMAARLALSSRHPLAAAVAREARDRTPYRRTRSRSRDKACVRRSMESKRASAVPPSAATQPPSSSRPGTSLIAFRHGDRSAVFAVRQTLRPDAAEVARSLRRARPRPPILSGDRPTAVAPVAAALGIAQWQGGLDPAEKIAAIEALKAAGRRVLMVGDGLNDAPALAAAHVSMSPISAADITQAQADAVFLGERLAPVLRSRRHRPPRPPPDAAEPVARGDLQRRRRADRDRRLRHPADRGAGDVGLLGAGHAQLRCAPRAERTAT